MFNVYLCVHKNIGNPPHEYTEDWLEHQKGKIKVSQRNILNLFASTMQIMK